MLSDLTQPSFRKRGSRIPAVVMPACRVVMVGVPGGYLAGLPAFPESDPPLEICLQLYRWVLLYCFAKLSL